MYCMRCGRELKEDTAAFCPDCRAAMSSCPVAPGTPVQLPQRSSAAAAKKKSGRRHREQKPEEQISRLRGSVRWLTFALIVAVLAFSFTATILLHILDQESVPTGRNYSTISQTDGT